MIGQSSYINIIDSPTSFKAQMEASPQKHEAETLPSLSGDELEEAQMRCIEWAGEQEWDCIKECVKKHGPEVLFGVYNYTHNNEPCQASVLQYAAQYKNVEMVELVLDAGFDDKIALFESAATSMKNDGDNTTILRMLLEHGLDPNMDHQVEGFSDVPLSTLMMEAAVDGCHINHAITLLDHGANVNKGGNFPDGSVISALTYSITLGRHDLCKLFLKRGAIPTTNDVDEVYSNCLGACKGGHSYLSSDLARAMLTTFLHLGKPDQDVIAEVHEKWSAKHRDPVITQITKQYLQGRPFCCEICEALTAKGRDKLLMCPCRTIAYCSRDCQVKNWKKHKDECQGALNEKGESEAMVKERKITGKGGGGKKGKKGRKKKT